MRLRGWFCHFRTLETQRSFYFNAVSSKSSSIKNAEFKRSADRACRGTEAGSKGKVGAMLIEHRARVLRLTPLVTEPRPRSNEPQPMQFEQKHNSVTDVTNSINQKFNAMLTNDKSTVLNPQAQGFICVWFKESLQRCLS